MTEQTGTPEVPSDAEIVDDVAVPQRPGDAPYENDHRGGLAIVGHGGLWLGIIVLVGSVLVASQAESYETDVLTGVIIARLIGGISIFIGIVSLVGLQVARSVSYDLAYRFGAIRPHNEGNKDY